jgi:hypothetical protein
MGIPIDEWQSARWRRADSQNRNRCSETAAIGRHAARSLIAAMGWEKKQALDYHRSTERSKE